MSQVSRSVGPVQKRRTHPHSWPTLGKPPPQAAIETFRPKFWRVIAIAAWLLALGIFAGFVGERLSSAGENIRIEADP